jgi:hypothetical protein
MLKRLVSVLGPVAALLALMVQIGIGASVQRPDRLAQIIGVETLCHASDDAGGPPGPAPAHPFDCLFCPLCAALHAPAPTPVSGMPIPAAPAAGIGVRADLPPPSTAPPLPQRPPGQPRAPPVTV